MSNTPPHSILLEKLYSLQQLLTYSEEKVNPLDSYNYFINSSPLGRDCSYAQKVLKIFKRKHYKKVKEKIMELTELINQIEGR